MTNTCENATLASQVFQMLSDGRLRDAARHIEDEITKREGDNPLVPQIIEWYNQTGLPKVMKLTDSRKRALKQRLKEHPDIVFWDGFFQRVKRSSFLIGRNGSGWTASFDWLMLPRNMQKVIEGNYDDRKSGVQLDANDRAVARFSA